MCGASGFASGNGRRMFVLGVAGVCRGRTIVGIAARAMARGSDEGPSELEEDADSVSVDL